MPVIRLQDITTTTSLDLTDKLLISDSTTENLVTVETLMAMAHLCFQGVKSGNTSLPGDATMNKLAVSATGLESPLGGSGMSIYDGGIKVSAAGTYKVTASVYMNVATEASGVYVHYGSTYSGATELCGVFTDTPKSTIKQVIGIATVPADTIFYLSGRAATGSGSTAGSGWLLVERYA